MKKFSLKKLIFSYGETPALIIGVLAFLFFSLFTKKFFSPYNISLVFNQMAIYGMLGTALTLVIIVGGMDISVGSTLSLCCAVEAMLWMHGKDLPNQTMWIILGCLGAVLVGTLIGMLLGTMITFFKIPDMVASLALQRVTRGIAIMVSGGATLSRFPKDIYKVGISKFLGLGLPFWVCLIFTIVFTIILAYTRFGRRIYMLGNNRVAASLAGIDVAKTRLKVYTVEGFAVGLTSIVYLAYNFTYNATSCGASILTYVLASALMGGASMDGGKGTAVGTFFGAFVLGTLMNGLIHFGVSAEAVDILIALLIMMVLLTQYLRNRASHKEAKV